ncbi:MAG: PHB depolymerase family esterase [Proteobacteria bacterium]|nr:MAG: PHB depolymerase family esterase [Pseudomonadota bacterium]
MAHSPCLAKERIWCTNLNMKALLLALAFVTSTLPAQAAWRRVPTANMQYWLYTPEGRSEAPRGLMLNLHGCTQHAQDFKDRGNWEASANKYNFAVAIPDVPNGGVVLGCWDYYGKDQSPSNHHNRALIEFTEGLVKDKALNIAPEKVYVAGLSSGAGQALLLGCLRPDLFHGVGLVGSPAIGTGQNDIAWPNVSAEAVENYCRVLSAGRSFVGQRTSIVHGDQDFIVNPKHSELITEALAAIYEIKDAEEINVAALPGTGTGGMGELYRDQSGAPRLSLISAAGLGHAWPAGTGAGFAMKYINPNSLNYPAYLGAFFAEQNSGGDSL